MVLTKMERKPVHIAMLTGGVMSAYMAYEMVKTYGKENCRLFFINSFSKDLGYYTNERIDEFTKEVAEYIGLPITVVDDGRILDKEVDETKVLGDLAQISAEKGYVESRLRHTITFLDELRNKENIEPILYFGVMPNEFYSNGLICHESIDNYIGQEHEISSIYKILPQEPIKTCFPFINDMRKDLDIKDIIQNKWGIRLPLTERKRVHIAMFSGGAGSAYVAYYMVQTFGKENCKLFFTNTLWEDEDNYRFMEEVAEYIGLEITEVVDGRTPEEVFYDYRYLGNSRLAKCSEELKVKQTLVYMEELRDKENLEPVLYFGIAPHEKHRRGPIDQNSVDHNIRKAAGIRSFYKHFPLEPIETRFPLIETIRKDLDAKGIIQNEWGIKLPRMYTAALEKAVKEKDPIAQKLVDNNIYGFSHANCGGRCVRGGFQHYATLYAIWPDQYREQEEMEERFRKHFKKDVSILKKHGKAYTLKQFRVDMEKEGVEKYLFITDETIPCVCSFS